MEQSLASESLNGVLAVENIREHTICLTDVIALAHGVASRQLLVVGTLSVGLADGHLGEDVVGNHGRLHPALLGPGGGDHGDKGGDDGEIVHF